MSELLRQREYASLETTKELLELCRREIVNARLKLSSDRYLKPEAIQELWYVINCREWFLKTVARDFSAELEQIDRELEAELSR